MHSRVRRVRFRLPSMLAQGESPGGIVYGPKASFNISAPEGWVVDNQAGKARNVLRPLS